MMSPRERVLTALSHEEPDRVPVYVEYTPEARRRALGRLGLGEERWEEPVLAETLHHDLLTFQVGPVTGYHLREEAEYEDEWGIRWRWIANSAGSRYTEICRHPLADCRDPAEITLPDFSAGDRYAGCAGLVQRYGDRYCIVGSIVCTLFELAWYLRGMERVMLDMCANKDFFHAYLDRLLEWALEAGSRLAALGVDILYVGDDFGSQSTMLISPAMFREFFKPRYARLYSAVKRVNPRLRIAHHSCGHILPIIGDFVEIGLDILNPVQPRSMDPAAVKTKFGRHLTLWGTVDEQRVLPFGTAAEVSEEVKLRLRTVAPGGGFIIAPAHNLQTDTPVENITAFYQTARACGEYPIRI